MLGVDKAISRRREFTARIFGQALKRFSQGVISIRNTGAPS